MSLVGTWIQAVAQSWLVFQLTGSAFLLGLTGFLNSIPVFLLSLFGGVVADRVDKRRILLVTQNAFMVLAFILAVLTHLGKINPVQIMVIAVLNGIVMAFDAPARQAVVVELVGKAHLLNAIALNSAAFNSARIVGPAVAGILIAGIGMSGCFYINGISFFAVIIALLFIRLNFLPRQVNTHFMKDLTEGLSFIKTKPVVVILITIVGITSLFGIFHVILMPVFADEILHVGVKGLGVLMSSAGAGALIAALMLARSGDFKKKGEVLFISMIVFCISLIMFALSKIYILSILSLTFVGWSSVSAMSIINTLLQTSVPDSFRGRIMSAFMFTFAGIMPFGNLLAGVLSHIWGAPFAVLSGALVCSIFFIIINMLYPELRKL